jgi:Flp pilus assembly protein TadG
MFQLARNQDGSVMVEAAVMIPIIFVFVLGSIDFLFAFYQWNAASKAVQLGARIAAVSDPVAQGLNDLSANVVGTYGEPGDQTMPAFTVICSGNASNCTCTGTCTGLTSSPPLVQAALERIVYGRGNNGTCNAPSRIYFAGMCNMFPGLQPANVMVVYTSPGNASGGLGYVGRPDGPVPIVQVSLQGLNFTFYFLGSLLGFNQIPIGPSATSPTTVTGEALSSCAQTLTGSSC